MNAAGQVIQPSDVSILRDTGPPPEPTPPAGMAKDLNDIASFGRRLYHKELLFMMSKNA